jgi:hypothetical protein
VPVPPLYRPNWATACLWVIVALAGSGRLAANEGPNEAKPPGIVFQTHSVTNEKPTTAEQLVAIFQRSPNFESRSVTAVTDLNRGNAFGKEDVNVGYRIAFQFYAAKAGEWTFDLAYDAGTASCVLIDDKPLFFTDQDIWVGYENPIAKTVVLETGWHSFEFLALEPCCGAPLRFTYRAPGEASSKVISPSTLQIYGAAIRTTGNDDTSGGTTFTGRIQEGGAATNAGSMPGSQSRDASGAQPARPSAPTGLRILSVGP